MSWFTESWHRTRQRPCMWRMCWTWTNALPGHAHSIVHYLLLSRQIKSSIEGWEGIKFRSIHRNFSGRGLRIPWRVREWGVVSQSHAHFDTVFPLFACKAHNYQFQSLHGHTSKAQRVLLRQGPWPQPFGESEFSFGHWVQTEFPRGRHNHLEEKWWSW